MRRERLGRTRVALSAGLLIGGLWTGAAALFTDSATTDAAFTSGSVDIAVTGEDATFFSASDMAPGDVVFEPLTVDNNGSLDFTYTMATVDDGSALAAGL
ncbi:MAG TPA: TasA family protein, partial [Egibacteraceae bacterium]|nr:TasA family protein [Egibacteraceae bacterium]